MIRRVKLKDVCREITVGHVGPMADQYVESGIPFLRSQNISPFRLDESNLKFINQDFHKKLKKSALSPGDVLVVRTGYPGTACVLPRRITVANCADLVIIRPSEGIDSYYLCCLFNSVWGRGKVAGNLVGVAQQHFNIGAAREMEISLPPISTQRRAADLLSAYDDLMENNSHRIKILEEMALMIYREWFVNFRFPGYEKVKMVESEIGLIPGGWKVVELAALYKTGSGGTPSRKVEEYFGGSIPWVKTRELSDGFIIDTEEKITESGLKYSSAKLFPRRTVLMAMYGATIGKLGMLTSAATCNQACCAMSENVEPFGAEYLFLTLKHKRDDIIGLRMGAAQQNISQEVIRSIRILRPREEAISSFNQLAGAIFDELRVLTQKNINLRKTRDLLLPKLISGEISAEHLEADAVAQTV
jgi:type I restriction enzyme S subunit